MILGVRTVRGRAYGGAEQRRERKKLVALRLPVDLHERLLRKMRALGTTKTEAMIQALENGLA